MENTYNVQITTKNGTIFTETVKALNELEAVDRVYAMWSNLEIMDIKVV